MTPRKPRKMPKNQRAYPLLKKLRLTEVSGEECQFLIDSQGEIGVPHLYTVDNYRGLFLVNAAELKKWRALRDPPTSSAEQI